MEGYHVPCPVSHFSGDSIHTDATVQVLLIFFVHWETVTCTGCTAHEPRTGLHREPECDRTLNLGFIILLSVPA